MYRFSLGPNGAQHLVEPANPADGSFVALVKFGCVRYDIQRYGVIFRYQEQSLIRIRNGVSQKSIDYCQQYRRDRLYDAPTGLPAGESP